MTANGSLVLSFYHVGPRDSTEVIRFGSKHLYPLNYFTAPACFLMYQILSSVDIWIHLCACKERAGFIPRGCHLVWTEAGPVPGTSYLLLWGFGT